MSPYAPSRSSVPSSVHQDDGRDVESRVLSTMNPTFSGPNRKDLSNEKKKKKKRSEKACVGKRRDRESKMKRMDTDGSINLQFFLPFFLSSLSLIRERSWTVEAVRFLVD